MAAITTRNVIEDVIIGTYVDNVSPAVKKMAANTKDSLKQVNRQFKDVGDVFRLAMGGAAGALLIRQYSQLVQFAKDHNTEAGKLGVEYDKITDSIKMSVVSSEAFKKTMEGVNTLVGLIDRGVMSIVSGMDKLDLSFLDFFGGVGAGIGAYQRFKQMFFPDETQTTGNENEVKRIVENERKRLKALQDAVARNREMEALKYKNDVAEYQAALDKATQKWINELPGQGPQRMGAQSFDPTGEYLNAAEIDDRERKRMMEKINFEKWIAKERLSIQEQRYIQETEMIDLWEQEIIDKEESYAQARIELWDSMKSKLFDGLVEGFQSIGEAMVNGTSAAESFGAVFVKTLGMIAVQLGSFMIAVGVGYSTLPEIFGLKGPVAIAAGVALVTLGGALGAVAANMQRAGGGSSGGASNNYRPDSSFDTPRAGTQTTVNVIVQALDPSQVGESTLRGLGVRVKKEIDKIDYLGRTVRFS